MGDVVVAMLESLLLPPGLIGVALSIWCVLGFVRRRSIGERALALAPLLRGFNLAAAAASLWGVDPDLFWPEGTSTNTYESAVEIKELLDERFPGRARHRILLVTSAWHMPRSVGVFEKAGVDVVPAPCDYMMGEVGDLGVPQLLPNHEAQSMLTVAVREWMAIVLYRVRDRF